MTLLYIMTLYYDTIIYLKSSIQMSSIEYDLITQTAQLTTLTSAIIY